MGLIKYAHNFVETDNLCWSIIEPHLSYCCFFWVSCCATKLNVLQKMQNKVFRIVTRSPIDASVAPFLQDLVDRETSSMVYTYLKSLVSRHLNHPFVRLSELHPRELRNSKTDLAIPVLRFFWSYEKLMPWFSSLAVLSPCKDP